MSCRYDNHTTIFLSEACLYQVEYTMEVIDNTRSTLDILVANDMVLVGEEKVTSKLL